MTFQATVLTLYPEMFPGPLGVSLAGRALEAGTWALDAVQIRDFAADKHRTVDDTPAGGGAGMVLRVDVLAAAVDYARENLLGTGRFWPERSRNAPSSRSPRAESPSRRPASASLRTAPASSCCAAVSKVSMNASSQAGPWRKSPSAISCFRVGSLPRSCSSMLAFGCFPA